MQIIYHDKDLIIVNKESGILTQGDITKRENLYTSLKTYIKNESKYKDPFLGIVHRLDFPVSGIVLFALNKRSAKEISLQFKNQKVKKLYYAIVENADDLIINHTKLYCYYKNKKTIIENSPKVREKSREILMDIQKIRSNERFTFFKINPITGRKNQIRAVMAYYGYPIIGDKKYGSGIPFKKDSIALHCREMTIYNSKTNENMTFYAKLPDYWEVFEDLISDQNIL